MPQISANNLAVTAQRRDTVCAVAEHHLTLFITKSIAEWTAEHYLIYMRQIEIVVQDENDGVVDE